MDKRLENIVVPVVAIVGAILSICIGLHAVTLVYHSFQIFNSNFDGFVEMFSKGLTILCIPCVLYLLFVVKGLQNQITKLKEEIKKIC